MFPLSYRLCMRYASYGGYVEGNGEAKNFNSTIWLSEHIGSSMRDNPWIGFKYREYLHLVVL